MQQAVRKISSEQVRKFFPLERLSQEDSDELLRTAIISRLSVGAPVFRNNDLPKQVFYLLAGELELITQDKGRCLIKGGTPEARKPIGRGIKGHISATACKDSLIISFDADMLELFLSWTNPEAYLVSEMQTNRSSEWLDRLLQSRGLLRFSEDHIQTLLNRMSEVHLNAGDVVIRQDSHDDYYYIIKNGRCRVTRTPETGAKEIKLAELRQGDAFGEEALLANTLRNANIVMEEDGDLMRLSKNDFSELLAAPLLNSVSWKESQDLIKGGAMFLDIRLPDEFSEQHLPGSVNIPLALLRLKLKQISHHRKYIVCCNDGSRSAVAAFLLSRHGFDAFILDGGLAGAPCPSAHGNTNAPHANGTTRLFSSMADYWGSTVDEPQQSSFEDAADIENINKTRSFSSTTPSTRATVTSINKTRTTVPPRTKITSLGIGEMPPEEVNTRRRNIRLIRSVIALAILAAAAIPALLTTLRW